MIAGSVLGVGIFTLGEIVLFVYFDWEASMVVMWIVIVSVVNLVPAWRRYARLHAALRRGEDVTALLARRWSSRAELIDPRTRRRARAARGLMVVFLAATLVWWATDSLVAEIAALAAMVVWLATGIPLVLYEMRHPPFSPSPSESNTSND
jgi:hypothetical protein